MTQICAAFALAAGVMVAATGAMAQEVEVEGNKTSVFTNDVFGGATGGAVRPIRSVGCGQD